MPGPHASLEDLPEDVLSLIFTHLHSSTRGNPAFSLAQCSRFLLSVFARTALRSLRHTPTSSCAHTAALLRVAGAQLRVFSISAPQRPPPGSAPALLDALALHCRQVRALELAAHARAAPPVAVKRVLCVCRELEEVTLVDPGVEVLRVFVRAGEERWGGGKLRRVVVRFTEASGEVLAEMAKAVGRHVVEMELEWSQLVFGARCAAAAVCTRVTGSINGVSDGVDDVAEELQVAGKVLLDLALRPKGQEQRMCSDEVLLSELRPATRTRRWVLSNFRDYRDRPCIDGKIPSQFLDLVA